MSLEVICDYKESLPIAIGAENPLLDDLATLKRSHLKNEKKMEEMMRELKELRESSSKILNIVTSLNKEILNLLEEPATDVDK